MERSNDKPITGKAVDPSGGPVIDPTANVQALSEASNKRQDDLREAQNKYMESELRALKTLADFREKHQNEISELRAEHQKEIGVLETNRLNAIRAVDQQAVSTASDRALAAIQTLAATTQANAENIRTSLTTTASTIAAQLQQTVAGITERITALERSSYEGKGKQALADPMMVELLSEMKTLRESRASNTGTIQGVSSSWTVLLGAVALIATVLAIVSYLKH